jgi:hypothetical protein
LRDCTFFSRIVRHEKPNANPFLSRIIVLPYRLTALRKQRYCGSSASAGQQFTLKMKKRHKNLLSKNLEA